MISQVQIAIAEKSQLSLEKLKAKIEALGGPVNRDSEISETELDFLERNEHHFAELYQEIESFNEAYEETKVHQTLIWESSSLWQSIKQAYIDLLEKKSPNKAPVEEEEKSRVIEM